MNPNIEIEKVSDYDLDNYKQELATKLCKYHTTGDDIAANSELKQFIENYVTENVIEARGKLALQGYTKKLAHMEVKLPGIVSPAVFPIIHTYHFHNLVSTTIFYIDENGKFKVDEVVLNKKKILV